MAGGNAIRAGRAFVELYADDSQLVRGLKSAQGKLSAFGSVVNTQGLHFGRLGSKLTQVSYALEDFTGVLGSGGGLAQAFRSTANNFGTLVTSINPIAGIAATVAFALGTWLIPKLFATGDAAKDAAKELESLEKRIDLSLTRIEQRHAAAAEIKRIASIFDDEAIRAEVAKVAADMDLATSKLVALRHEHAQLNRNRPATPEQNQLLEKQITDQIAKVNELDTALENLAANQSVATLQRSLSDAFGLKQFARELAKIRDIDAVKEITSQLEAAGDATTKLQNEIDVLVEQRAMAINRRDIAGTDALTKQIEDVERALRQEQRKTFDLERRQHDLRQLGPDIIRQRLDHFAGLNFAHVRKQIEEKTAVGSVTGTFSGDSRQFTGGTNTLHQTAQKQLSKLDEINTAIQRMDKNLSQGLAVA